MPCYILDVLDRHIFILGSINKVLSAPRYPALAGSCESSVV